MKDFFTLFKKSGRGGEVICDKCNARHYMNKSSIKNAETPTCPDCIEPKIKIKKKRKRSDTKEYQDIRKILLCIYDDTCQECGLQNFLQIHHIDEDHTNNSYDNLVVLCKFCHAKKHPDLSRLILNHSSS